MEKIKKPIFKKWWFWVIIIILALAVIGNLSGDDSTTQGDSTTPASTPPESKPEKEDPEPEVDSRTITEVGTGIETKNFKVAVEGLRKPNGNNFLKPSEGKEFVEVILLIENISDKDYNVSSLLMFDAYYDGFTVNQSITAAALTDDLSTLDGSLAAGKKMRGKLPYELPIDWEELEINVDLTMLSFSSDGEIKILLQNE